MLLSKGRPAPSEPWRILEVAISQAPDVLAIRLAKELKRIHEPAVQVLVPFRRNREGEPEWIVEHVYVRGANGSLRLLARTPGIEFTRRETAEHSWIERLLEYEQEQMESTFLPGQFVRVLTGPCARMCGTIRSVRPKLAIVQIELPTKQVRVSVPLTKLQSVECSPENQTFFFRSDLFA